MLNDPRWFVCTLTGLALTAPQCFAQSNITPYRVTTLAGHAPSWGSVDGVGSAARFHQPFAVAVDNEGTLYVADTANCTIRNMTLAGTNWTVRTIAGLAGNLGSVDGIGSAARFYYPRGVAVDNSGNIFVADLDSHVIRELTSQGTNWTVTTVAGLAGYLGSTDGVGSSARFHEPLGVAIDSTNNVYVGDYFNNTIRKMTPAGTNWVVTTLAGLAGSSGSADGSGTGARFKGPAGVAVDGAGNVIVGDHLNHTIRKVTPEGVVTTLAGLALNPGRADGSGSNARFNMPFGVAVDRAGNVYVADQGNDTIRQMTLVGTNWMVTTLAGLAGSVGPADGTGSEARFNLPAGVAVDSVGNIYVADTFNHTVRKGFPQQVPVISTSGPGFGFNGGQFGFNLNGPDGQFVVVDASTDLLNWLPIWTNVFAGSLNFADPQSGGFSNRFFRAHLP